MKIDIGPLLKITPKRSTIFFGKEETIVKKITLFLDFVHAKRL